MFLTKNVETYRIAEIECAEHNNYGDTEDQKPMSNVLELYITAI